MDPGARILYTQYYLFQNRSDQYYASVHPMHVLDPLSDHSHLRWRERSGNYKALYLSDKMPGQMLSAILLRIAYCASGIFPSDTLVLPQALTIRQDHFVADY